MSSLNILCFLLVGPKASSYDVLEDGLSQRVHDSKFVVLESEGIHAVGFVRQDKDLAAWKDVLANISVGGYVINLDEVQLVPLVGSLNFLYQSLPKELRLTEIDGTAKDKIETLVQNLESQLIDRGIIFNWAHLIVDALKFIKKCSTHFMTLGYTAALTESFWLVASFLSVSDRRKFSTLVSSVPFGDHKVVQFLMGLVVVVLGERTVESLFHICKYVQGEQLSAINKKRMDYLLSSVKSLRNGCDLALRSYTPQNLQSFLYRTNQVQQDLKELGAGIARDLELKREQKSEKFIELFVNAGVSFLLWYSTPSIILSLLFGFRAVVSGIHCIVLLDQIQELVDLGNLWISIYDDFSRVTSNAHLKSDDVITERLEEVKKQCDKILASSSPKLDSNNGCAIL